jgi:opacity protein-like surface antigen
MRKLLTLFAAALILTTVSAPKAFSQVELFGGYSHLGLNNAPSNIGSSSNGWEGSAYLHLLGPWGAEADISDHYGVSQPDLAPLNGSRYYVPGFSELYGPRFTLALPKVHPFVHALFGTVHGVADVAIPAAPCTPQGCPAVAVSENAFALGLGGGVNFKVTQHLWLRLIQVDYIRSQFTGGGQNETRISAGLVFRFGNW